MRVPNAGSALVEKEKIVGYLLDLSHPDGAGKADFFIRIGFGPEAWRVFADALREHAMRHPVASFSETEYGTKYVVDGDMGTPDCRFANVRTVWIVDRGFDRPRLITAHPI